MRKIKFRGQTLQDGRIIYGDLQHDGKLVLISDGLHRETIKPDSAEQLIGMDSNGREIYEGDKVIRVLDYDDDGELIPVKRFPMAATFEDYGAILNGEIIFVRTK